MRKKECEGFQADFIDRPRPQGSRRFNSIDDYEDFVGLYEFVHRFISTLFNFPNFSSIDLVHDIFTREQNELIR